jgi:HSP20 family protein
MAIVKRGETPAHGRMQELADLRRRMLHLLEEPFGLPIFREPVGWMPDVDITETDSAILLRAELPGMSKENVEIEIEGNLLTLKGEKQDEMEEQEKEHCLYECSYGAFQRSFTLPTAVKESEAKAEFSDGVLRVTLPKNGAPHGKRIPIGD